MNIQLLYGVFVSEKDIANATDNAKIFISDISYVNKEKIVYIPFRYFEKEKNDKRLLDKFFPKKIELKNSLVIIKNVESLEIVNNCKDKTDEITVLFGLTIEGNEIYLSSAEEYRGDVFFEMSIIVNNIDIEIIRA
jgi:hypothetical protein